jgi:hypothetical protein
MSTSDDYFVATGEFGREGGMPGFWAETDANNNPKLVTGGQMTGTFAGVWGQGGGGVGDFQISANRMVGVVGLSPQGGLGVFGQSEATSTAPSTLTPGVLGTADTSAGVVGWSTTWNGVEGWAPQGTGVLGVSEYDSGVHGASTWQPGVLGASDNDSGVMGLAGPEGTQGPMPDPNILPTIAGVLGTSDGQAGVIGTSNRTAGVLGLSNNVGVYGVGTNYAGIFRGNFLVVGGHQGRCGAVPGRYAACALLHGEPGSLV